MADVRYVIDMDGFTVQNVFRAKELAVGDIKNNTCVLHHFKVGGNFHLLNDMDRKTAIWLRHNKTGLYFTDEKYQLAQEHLMYILENLCDDARNNNVKIAYKGGKHEKTYLKKFGCSDFSVDLENIGCPVVEDLKNTYSHLNFDKEQCSLHYPLYNFKTPHCSKVEVLYFMEFVKDFQKSWSCSII
jgi:hypothetical protein